MRASRLEDAFADARAQWVLVAAAFAAPFVMLLVVYLLSIAGAPTPPANNSREQVPAIEAAESARPNRFFVIVRSQTALDPDMRFHSICRAADVTCQVIVDRDADDSVAVELPLGTVRWSGRPATSPTVVATAEKVISGLRSKNLPPERDKAPVSASPAPSPPIRPRAAVRYALDGRVQEVKSGQILQLRDSWAMRTSQKQGEKTLLILWTTYCAPCITELPDLHALRKTSGVRVVGLLDELPTPTNKKLLADLIKPYPSLSSQYYLVDPSLKAALFGDIPGEKDSIPAFRLLDSEGYSLAAGRGTITHRENKVILDAVLHPGEAPDKPTKSTAGAVAAPATAETSAVSSASSASTNDPAAESRRYFDRCLAGNPAYSSALREAATFFRKKELSTAESAGILHSLWRMLAEQPAKAVSDSNHGTIALWVDVTCEMCAKAVDVAERALTSDATAVKIEYVAIAGPTAESERAAAILETIRQRAPDLYQRAVAQFVETLPTHPAAITGLAEDYLDTPQPETLPEWPISIARVRKTAELSRGNPTPPFFTYRGRRITRDPRPAFGMIAFDPFADASLFALAVKTIDICERREK